MSNVTYFSPDGGATHYDLEDTTARAGVANNFQLLRDGEVIEGKNKYNVAKSITSGTTSIFTKNNDGTYTVNGTASTLSYVTFNPRNESYGSSAIVKSGTYVISGLPSGYGTDVYAIAGVTKNGAFSQLAEFTSADGSATITVTTDDYSNEGMQIQFSVYVKADTVVTNAIIAPMLCTQAEWNKSQTYESFYIPVKDSKLDIVDYKVTSAVNLMPNVYDSSKAINNVTFVKNSDGTVAVSTTAEGASSRTVFEFCVLNHYDDILNDYGANRYRLTGCPNGGSDSKYKMYLHPGYTGSSWVSAVSDYGDGCEFYYDGTSSIYCAIAIPSGSIITTPIIFKPMISLAGMNLHYADYVSWCMTNRELTEKYLGRDWENATINTTNVMSGTVKYRIKNGICFVTLNGVKLAVTGNAIQIASGLPKAEYITFAAAISGNYQTPAENGLFIKTGETILNCNVATITGTDIFGSLSYPIAD